MADQHIKNIGDISNINSEFEVRRKKLDALRKNTIPFPNDFRRNYTSNKLSIQFGQKSRDELEVLNIQVKIAGRMMKRRIMGRAAFVTIKDMEGYIQLYISCSNLPIGFYDKQFKKWDLGDILGAKGTIFKTKTNVLSIRCIELYLLTKALRPLPDKFHGLQNREICYRQRYLDLIANDKSYKIFKIRSNIITSIRKFMTKKDFMEVETPMMHMIPGGASARPFVTHHNALNLDMFLRISPELYLKRLVISGFERIFEINRNFRNEGISTIHNPEFTMMELYLAYADYKDLIELSESLFRTLAKDIFGTTKIHYNSYIFDFEKPFSKLTMKEAIKKYHPETNIKDLNNLHSAKKFAESLGIKIEKHRGLGFIITKIFEEVVEDKLIQPTFITEYPIEVSPLSRRNDNNPEIADRFELFIGGYEIGNGFSELNDSEDQMKRFENQILKKDNCDNETLFFDKDYLIALEHGLPPTAGLGIGIDRIVMIFTNSQNIRDVILFPMMRPAKNDIF